MPHPVLLSGFNSLIRLNKFTYLRFCLPQSDQILFNLSIQMFERTEDKLTLYLKRLVIKPQLNPGVQEELCLVFLVFLEVEHIVPVRPLLEICVVEDVCLPPLKPGEDGTVG